MPDEKSRERWAPSRIEEVAADGGSVYVLGLRETADDPDSWSLLLMEGDPDEEPGMNTYCLVVDPGQYVAYGGVLECELSGNRLRLLLSEETAEALGTPPSVMFTLAVPHDHLAEVGSGLARVLRSGRIDAVPRILSV